MVAWYFGFLENLFSIWSLKEKQSFDTILENTKTNQKFTELTIDSYNLKKITYCFNFTFFWLIYLRFNIMFSGQRPKERLTNLQLFTKKEALSKIRSSFKCTFSIEMLVFFAQKYWDIAE